MLHPRITNVARLIIQGIYISDDISLLHDNHPSYILAPSDRRERLTILLHEQLDQVIYQEQQLGLSLQDMERLATLRQQTMIRHSRHQIRSQRGNSQDLERKYKTRC